MKLFYRKYGRGPVLIILHGLFGSSDNWTTIARKISGDFTVILPDLRNHGQSPHSDVHDYDSMRDDLYQLVTDLSIEKFFLAGHSMGGKTAMAFALKWPERLNGLLVADISPFTGDDNAAAGNSYHAGILRSILALDLSKISSRGEAESELERSGFPPEIRGFILKSLKRVEDNRFKWKLNAPALLNNLEKIMSPLEKDMILSHRVTGFPVIFTKGSKSGYLPEQDYPGILNIFPAAEFIEIPGAGHWLHADNPEEVTRSIRKLLL
jgi:esterase